MISSFHSDFSDILSKHDEGDNLLDQVNKAMYEMSSPDITITSEDSISAASFIDLHKKKYISPIKPMFTKHKNHSLRKKS
mmetsp:Transcript_8182/g.10400  ORF Transcript_8182/g.10400 Transcript_8182/m.10400 type:complete len:80 (+) Transcript_8182:1940-2179(+)